MKSQAVFQQENELNRLAVQKRLLSAYEAPVFERLIAGRTGLKVLDVGCNDGSKTVERFSCNEVSGVIGLEYNENLAGQAQERYGGERFSFYACDVEAADFEARLKKMMAERGIEGFDVIYLSFLLMHLKNPRRFLTVLRRFLTADGTLVVVEANDSASTLSPCGELLAEFLEILSKDPYSGNREFGRGLPEMLCECGYADMKLWHDAISASGSEETKKRDIFTMFFSYLPEDVALLLEQSPENEEYLRWFRWVKECFGRLRAAVTAEDSYISMGMRILTCGGGLK